jgi:thiosulfate dehydrogenase
MNKFRLPLLRIIIEAFAIVVIAGSTYFFFFAGNMGNKNLTDRCIVKKIAREEDAYNQLQFNLVDPNDAPPPLKELADLGFNIMVETKKYAPEYVGNDLRCTNCHFGGGNTTGGPQGSISLAGVATKYPAMNYASDKVLDLQGRINNCFLKSMNGKALPLDSQLMLALVTYLHWISKNLPIYGNIPWLEIKPLSSHHEGDPEKGKVVYDTYCAVCHEETYHGEIYPPPLWGDGAFNDAAGMARKEKLSSFIYWNMPYDDDTPVLSEEEAIDVASYILTKPRPHFKG